RGDMLIERRRRFLSSDQKDRCMKRKSPMLTAEIAAKIKGYWDQTDLNQAQIAALLGGINQGRVSEVVRGLRFAEVPAAQIGGTSDGN
ncbi:MAG: hypothetical protein KF904_20425, partial [Rhodoblastus sp.]|nr:hypothetical protein [Rhodoblastus sp.]